MRFVCNLLFAFLALGFLATAAEAQFKRPSLSISPTVKIKGSRLTLKELAVIHPGESEYRPLVTALEDVDLGESPAPRTKAILLGPKILEAIEAANIPLEGFKYSIPKAIAVEREGRSVTQQEVLEAVRDLIWKDKDLDLQIREVQWPMEQVIPMGVTQIRTARLGQPTAGKLPLRVEVVVDESPSARFLATALVDDWREVPVPTRVVERGMLVSPEDIQLVRINLLQQPADIVASAAQMIGKRAKSRLTPGETVRKNALDIPPVIEKGKKVNVLYRKGLLSATMSGIALEDGFDDGEIRIRNDASKRTVVGKVVDAETVSVDN